MSEQTAQNTADIDEMTFRQAIAELDSIVAKLESNTMELEDSLAAYERGVALLRNLRSRLDGAQQKVDVLMGQLQEGESDDVIDSTLQKA